VGRSIQSNQSLSINLAEVESALADTQFAGRVLHLASTTSTNDLALAAAQSGARSGVWIADQQTAGRGRGSHTWHSTAGAGLYMSALIAPAIPMQSALSLSFTTAIAVQSAIASVFGFRIRDEIDIRWPNDLLLNRKKVGGILIETAASAAQPATLRYAVVGIGINLNHTAFPPELDAIATSIRRELPAGAPGLASETWVHCEPLAAAILLALDAELRRLTTDNLQPATCNSRDLSRFSSWITGKRVRVEACDDDPASYTGITKGLDPQGFLRVLGDDGQLHTVLSGGLRDP
jgi:BirA family biotin operon repressor/biotin-[acetyl-CoA-carboxylase] ligase